MNAYEQWLAKSYGTMEPQDLAQKRMMSTIPEEDALVFNRQARPENVRQMKSFPREVPDYVGMTYKDTAVTATHPRGFKNSAIRGKIGGLGAMAGALGSADLHEDLRHSKDPVGAYAKWLGMETRQVPIQGTGDYD